MQRLLDRYGRRGLFLIFGNFACALACAGTGLISPPGYSQFQFFCAGVCAASAFYGLGMPSILWRIKRMSEAERAQAKREVTEVMIAAIAEVRERTGYDVRLADEPPTLFGGLSLRKPH